MKKKYREITVDGVKYAWTLHNNCDGDGGNCIRIWKDRKIMIEELIRGDIDITPKFISELIRVYNNSTYRSPENKVKDVRRWISTLSYSYVIQIKTYVDASKLLREYPDFMKEKSSHERQKMAIQYTRKHLNVNSIMDKDIICTDIIP